MTVTTDENIKGERPVIEGTKISVLQIKEMVVDNDVPVERVVNEFSFLSTSDVESALDYIDENPEEMEKLRKKRAEAKEELLEIGEVYKLR